MKDIKCPEASTYKQIYELSLNQPDATAYEFYGKKTTYAKMLQKVDYIAKCLIASEIGPGDQVTFCMPRIPQTVDCFYALNRIGANSAIVNPEASSKDIARFLEESSSKMIITLERYYDKVSKAIAGLDHPVQIILARTKDELALPLKLAYGLAVRSKTPDLAPDEYVFTWADFLKCGKAIADFPKELPKRNNSSVIIFDNAIKEKNEKLDQMNIDIKVM